MSGLTHLFYPEIKFYSSPLISDLEAKFLEIGFELKFQNLSDEDNVPDVNLNVRGFADFNRDSLLSIMKFIDRTKEEFLSRCHEQRDKDTIAYICEQVRSDILSHRAQPAYLYNCYVYDTSIYPGYFEAEKKLPHLAKVVDFLRQKLKDLVLNQHSLDLPIPELGLTYLLSIKTHPNEDFLLFHTTRKRYEFIKSILILLNYGYKNKDKPINLLTQKESDYKQVYSVTPYQEHLTKDTYYCPNFDLQVYRNSQGRYLYLDKLNTPLSLFDSLYHAIVVAGADLHSRIMRTKCVYHDEFYSYVSWIGHQLLEDDYILALSSLLNYYPAEEFEQRFAELVTTPHLKSHYQLEKFIEFAKTKRDRYIDRLLSKYILLTSELEGE